MNPSNIISIPLPPVSSVSTSTIINGPIWGQINWCSETDDDSTVSKLFVYRLRILQPNQDMSWMRPGVISPPWAIEKVLGNDHTAPWDKGAIDLEADFELRIMPLQVPGAIPGAPWNYREMMLLRYKEQQRVLGGQPNG